MASGRLASGSIAAGAATKLYKNTSGKAQVITLLASSQVSGKSPKLNVKITAEDLIEDATATTTTVTTGASHSITTSYPSLSAQIAGDSVYTSSASASGSRLHLGVHGKEAGMSMGQAWSAGFNVTPSGTKNHAWSKVSFDGQPMGVGGTSGGDYDHHDNSNSHCRTHMPCYPPYYFENPNAFNQRKARGVLPGNDANTIFHIEDISKMPPATLAKYYNTDYNSGSSTWSYTNPGTSSSTWGTVTQVSTPSNYANRGWIYDVYTGLFWGWNNSGYNSYMYFDETTPTMNTSPYRNYGDSSSNGGVWRWSNGSWTGSDPAGYQTDGRGSPYGCNADCDNGLVISTSGSYSTKMGMKYYDTLFDNMMDKDDRVINQDLEAFSRSSYYHTISNQGNARYFRLQWVAYHPGDDKYYACFWDTSGDYNATGGATKGTSYTAESGIFQVFVDKIYGKGQTPGNTQDESFANAVSNGVFVKKAEVPDSTSGLMSKPMRIADSLWTAHCQDGKQYFSSNLYTWDEKNTDHMPDAYEMRNDSIKGSAGTTETNYYIASGSTSVIYSQSVTEAADLYDQAAVAGIIAKGAVTPYEQKSIILSNGDVIYVENEDTTDGISITAMGVDI